MHIVFTKNIFRKIKKRYKKNNRDATMDVVKGFGCPLNECPSRRVVQWFCGIKHKIKRRLLSILKDTFNSISIKLSK